MKNNIYKDLIYLNNKVRRSPFVKTDLNHIKKAHGGYLCATDINFVLCKFDDGNVGIFTKVYLRDYIIDDYDCHLIRWLTPLEIMLNSFMYNNIQYSYNVVYINTKYESLFVEEVA